MGYTLVKSFERGIDTRKLIDTTEPGALIDGRDCHITLGGELEKRAAFVVAATLPATTVGLWVTEGRVYHTWGDAPTATPPAGLPPGTIYHGVPDPDGSPLAHVLSVEEFNGDLYVVVQYEDNHVYHWYKDALVTLPPLPAVPGGGTPPPSSPINKPQVTLTFAPNTFGGVAPVPPDVTITKVWLLSPTSSFDFDPVGGVDAIMLIPTTGVDGFGSPIGNIPVVGGFDTPTLVTGAIMNAVNAFVTTTIKVWCQASGNQVLFWVDAPGPAFDFNGWKIDVAIDHYSLAGSSSTLMRGTLSGGVSGSPAPAPPPASSGPGDPIEKGTFALAHNLRMFAVQGPMLNYSAPRDPTNWTNTAALSGFIDHTMMANRAPYLVSMADYGGDLAVFGKRHVFVWSIDVVPAGDRKKQTLHGTGTDSPHSVVPYGQSDVMYLDISGIRSLRARDSSEQAFAADIGNLIDDLVRVKASALTIDQQKYNVWGVVEPRSGRLWMALLDRIFVLSLYPTSRISAWTYYDATSAPVDMMVTSDHSVYWRSGNNIIIYGGEDGDVYDATEALARIPYIDAGKPASAKNWTGIDLALFGTWQVRASFDPTAPTALDLIANLTKSTYAQQKIAMNGESPGVSLELRSTYVGPARVANAAIHFTDSTAD